MNKELKKANIVVDKPDWSIDKYIKENYIEKKKINNKIAELKEEIDILKSDNSVIFDSGVYKLELQIKVLEELLDD